MSFVAECRTMSAPSASGRWRSGVANVASTTVIAPRSRAPAAIAETSATTMSGLAIDSTPPCRPVGRREDGVCVVGRDHAEVEAPARLSRSKMFRTPGTSPSTAQRSHPAAERSDRGRRREAGGERHGSTSVQRAERRLERAPSRVTVAAVFDGGVVDIGRAHVIGGFIGAPATRAGRPACTATCRLTTPRQGPGARGRATRSWSWLHSSAGAGLAGVATSRPPGPAPEAALRGHRTPPAGTTWPAVPLGL